MAIQDTRVRRVIERLTHVSPPPGIDHRVFEIQDAESDVGHLFLFSILEHELEAREVPNPFLKIEVPGFKVSASSVIEIYLSRNGVKLLELAKQATPGKGVSAVLFLEIGREDLLSDRVFEIVPASDVSAQEFLWLSSHFAHVLWSELRILPKAYRKLVEERFAAKPPAVLDRLGDLVSDLTAELLDELEKGLDELAKAFARGKLPEELWNPEKRPQDFNAFMQRLGATLDQGIGRALTATQKLSKLELDLPQIPGENQVPFVAGSLVTIRAFLKLSVMTWNQVVSTLASIAAFLQKHRPDVADVHNTVIGYLSGIWDGIIDSLTGFIEMASLAVSLLAGFIRASKDFASTLQLALEAIDQIIQAFSRVDWIAVWDHFAEEEVPKLIEFLEDNAVRLVTDKIATSSAAVSYYFGYLVYNIAESFFPPLKLSKASKAAQQTSRFADLLFSA